MARRHVQHDPAPEVSSAGDFAEAFCRHHGLAEEDWVEALLWESLAPRSVPLARWIHRMAPGYFRQDLDELRSLARNREAVRFHKEVESLVGRSLGRPGWLRRWLHLRPSGRRLMQIHRDLLVEPATSSPARRQPKLEL